MFGTPSQTASPDILGSLTIAQVFYALAIQVDGSGCWDDQLVIDWIIDGRRHRATLSNGVLTHQEATPHLSAPADATLSADKLTFMQAALNPAAFDGLVKSGRLQVEGNTSSWGELMSKLDSPDPSFDIVLP